MYKNKSGKGLSVNTKPAPVALNTAQGDVDTPTRLRDERDVNSPRGNGDSSTLDFPTDSENGGAAPNFMTRVDRPDEDEALTNQQRQVTQDDSRCCSWLCCYSKPVSSSETADVGSDDGGTVMMTKPTPTAPTVAGNAGEETREASISESEDPEGLLEPRAPEYRKKKCLVLDLDETLVHSSFKPVPDADFIVPVEIDDVTYKVYVLKRPFVDEFLREVAKHYEVVIFTASLSLYANPLLDMLDTDKVIAHRLFRESCTLHGQAYVKDMSKLGRKMKDIMIVDNSPLSYAFQPTSAIPIHSWFDDRNDTELNDLLPVLETTLKDCKDVRDILDANNKSYNWLCNQAR